MTVWLSMIEAVGEFARSELEPHAQEWDQEKHFPRETIRRGGELGVAGVGEGLAVVQVVPLSGAAGHRRQHK